MNKNEKFKYEYEPTEIDVIELSADIITTSGEVSNGFDGEVDNW